MLRLGWAGAILAALLCGAAPQEARRPLAPIGPLGYWKGDDGEKPASALDSSGNGFNGAFSPGAASSPQGAPLKFPNPGCFDLDGKTGMITIPDNPVLRITGDLTLSFWKRKTAIVHDWVRLVGKGNGAQRNFGLWEYPEGDGRLKFQIYGTAGGSVLELDSPAPTAINTWTHICCVISVNSAALWVNGALVGNAMRNGEPGTAPDPITFGHAGYHGFFPGQLDDIRIYNRPLSMSEIVYLAQGNGPPAAPAALEAAGVDASKVTLKWKASATPPPAGTATYYVVKRSTTAGSGYAPVASGLPICSCSDSTAPPGGTYYYVVTPVNTGGEGQPSNEIKVVVPPK